MITEKITPFTTLQRFGSKSEFIVIVTCFIGSNNTNQDLLFESKFGLNKIERHILSQHLYMLNLKISPYQNENIYGVYCLLFIPH